MLLNIFQTLGHSSTASDINLVEVVTAGILVFTAFLTISFWYMANRPNIIVRPELNHGALKVVLRNDGKVAARQLVLKSDGITTDRYSNPPRTLDAQLPSMAPGEEIIYFVTVGAKAESMETVNVRIEHNRWLLRWALGLRRCRRDVSIDFSQYVGALADVHMPSNLENQLERLAEIGNALVKEPVTKGDRWRYLRYRLQQKAKHARERTSRLFTAATDRRKSS